MKVVAEVHGPDRATPDARRYDDADVRALIGEYPLAWVCGGAGDAGEASLLPLIAVCDDGGRLTELIGHLVRANPLHASLRDDARATILFAGPDGYISPEYAGERDWAPTWNYAQLKIAATVTFDDALTDRSLDLLTDAMERGRPQPWRVDELGTRYAKLRERIIGFRARVTRIDGRFKLGQEERPETLARILAALPDGRLAAWMRRFNRGR